MPVKEWSRHAILQNLKGQIAGLLEGAVSAEEAVTRGLVPTGKVFAVYRWSNVKAAHDEMTAAGDGAVLVWRRDKKDVEVWARPQGGGS